MMNHILMPLMLMLFISACGKTGALYLPETESAVVNEETPVENPVKKNEETDSGSL